MRKILALTALILFFWAGFAIANDPTFTTHYHLTKPGKGDSAWRETYNENFDTLDSGLKGAEDGSAALVDAESLARQTQDNYLYQQILLKYGDLVARLGSLPEIYVTTGTFNGPTGRLVTLPKIVSAITEYAVMVEPTTRGAAIGDIHVGQTDNNATIYCAESNTTDTFKAIIFYREDSNPYGMSVHRKWYVTPDDNITDHCDNSTPGSLAWVVAQVAGYYADVELPGNHEYAIDSNCTIPDTINLVRQGGARLAIATGKSLTVENTSGPINQWINATPTSGRLVLGKRNSTVYAEWFGTIVEAGVTDMTVAINAAIQSAPEGATIRGFATTYMISGAGIILNRNVKLEGFGMYKTVYQPSAGYGPSVNLITVSPNGAAWGMSLANFSIGTVGNVRGNHGIYFNCLASGQQWAFSELSNVDIEKTNGRSIYVDGGAADRWFDNKIRNSLLYSGIGGTYVGDTVEITGNKIAGPEGGIDITQVAGSYQLNVHDNVFTSACGLILHRSLSPRIMNNLFESAMTEDNSTLCNQATIYLKGDVGEIYDAQIKGNMGRPEYTINGATFLYVDHAMETIFDENEIAPGKGGHKLFTTTSNAYGTKIGFNYDPSGYRKDWLFLDTATDTTPYFTDNGICTSGVPKLLTLYGTWAKTDTQGTPYYVLDRNHWVQFSGQISDGNASTVNGSEIFAIPRCAQPPNNWYWPAWALAVDGFYTIGVRTNAYGAGGTAEIYPGAFSPPRKITYLNLGTIRYQTADYIP